MHCRRAAAVAAAVGAVAAIGRGGDIVSAHEFAHAQEWCYYYDMRSESLFALRRALLLAIGAGATGALPVSADGTDTGSSGPSRGPGSSEDDESGGWAGSVCDPTNANQPCVYPGEPYNECNVDADCHGAYPKCVQRDGQLGPLCQCDDSCRTDADCKSGEVCVCGDELGEGFHATCVAAPCREDSECESGWCDLSVYINGCGPELQLACHTAADTCASDADCGLHQHCVFDGLDRRWDCLGITCIIGRPLTIDGRPRTAPIVPRADWLADLELRPDVPDEVAKALTAHWSEVAALEHASVASFARFTLELMALGAPPELLAETQRAALDEVNHARVACALASLWAGRQVGPGPLSLAAVPVRTSVSEIVHALVKEGCVGETLGAIEAEELAAASGHPTMVPIFRAIALDEARHAVLAWRALRWILLTRGGDARLAALAAFTEARAELATPVAADHAARAPAWGLLPRTELVARRREAFAAVVQPVLMDIMSASAKA